MMKTMVKKVTSTPRKEVRGISFRKNSQWQGVLKFKNESTKTVGQSHQPKIEQKEAAHVKARGLHSLSTVT